jgi:hypothetical protein
MRVQLVAVLGEGVKFETSNLTIRKSSALKVFAGARQNLPRSAWVQRIVLLLWLGFVTSVTILLAQSNPKTSKQKPQPPQNLIDSQVEASSNSVVGRSWVDADRVEVRTRLWVVLENRDDTQAREVRLVDFHLPGFNRAGDCWPADPRSWPVCVIGQPLGSTTSLTIPSRSTLILWGDLERATLDPGRIVISGVFEWVDASDGGHQSAFQTEPVELPGMSWKYRPLGLPQEFLNVVSALLLPLTLLGLGWKLQTLQQRRTDKQAVWASMLPKSHENAEKYYMPVVSAVDAFCSRVSEVQKRSGHLVSEDFDQATYFLILIFKRMRQILRKIGGLYFKSRLGERIASDSWNIFSDRRQVIGRKLLDDILDQITQFESFARFSTKRRNPDFDSDFQRIRNALMEWAGYDAATKALQWDNSDLKFDILLLKLFRNVLDVEMNRPLALWYGEEKHLPGDETCTIWTELQGVLKGRRDTLEKEKAKTASGLGP